MVSMRLHVSNYEGDVITCVPFVVLDFKHGNQFYTLLRHCEERSDEAIQRKQLTFVSIGLLRYAQRFYVDDWFRFRCYRQKRFFIFCVFTFSFCAILLRIGVFTHHVCFQSDWQTLILRHCSGLSSGTENHQ